MNNQQISLIEDEELETLRLKALWADTGSGYSVALGVEDETLG